MIGRIVLCHVEDPNKTQEQEQEYAIILPHNLEVTTAPLMDPLIPKLRDATETLVQVIRLVEFFKR